MEQEEISIEDSSYLTLGRAELRFARPETEKDYRRWYVEGVLPSVRAGVVAHGVAWTSALLVGAAVLPTRSVRLVAALIVGLTVPPVLASWAAMRHPSRFEWVLPSIMLNVTVSGIVAVLLSFRFDLPEIATASVVALSFVASTVVRLHVLEAAASIAPFMVLNQLLLVARLQSGGTDSLRFGAYSLIVTNSVIVGLLACAAFDRASRQSFRRERIIAMQRKAIEREVARADVAERARQLSEALLHLSGALVVPPPLRPGDVIVERYRVVRALGRGGMGEVHEAERTTDGMRLALKVLTGNVARSALARFAREAQIASQFEHPHVVTVRDVGVSPSGMLFLVMDLVRGSTLAAERTRYGDIAWAFPILAQIASALATMHERGIVHRDLKPANVLLGASGARVADFGLACLGVAEHPPEATTSLAAEPAPADITRTGAILGTPLYMAPELTNGIRLARSSADVWSFGVIAHELLTGRLPFSEAPLVARLAGRSDVIAVTPLNSPAVPFALSALIDACLHRNPMDRPTAAALRDALTDAAVR